MNFTFESRSKIKQTGNLLDANSGSLHCVKLFKQMREDTVHKDTCIFRFSCVFGTVFSSQWLAKCMALSFVFKLYRKVHLGNDQEKAQSEKDPHSKNRGGKKTN